MRGLRSKLETKKRSIDADVDVRPEGLGSSGRRSRGISAVGRRSMYIRRMDLAREVWRLERAGLS